MINRHYLPDKIGYVRRNARILLPVIIRSFVRFLFFFIRHRRAWKHRAESHANDCMFEVNSRTVCGPPCKSQQVLFTSPALFVYGVVQPTHTHRHTHKPLHDSSLGSSPPLGTLLSLFSFFSFLPFSSSRGLKNCSEKFHIQVSTRR